jgi:hypothetical protein
MCGGCGCRPRFGNIVLCEICRDRHRKRWRTRHPNPRTKDPTSHNRASNKYRMNNRDKCRQAELRSRRKLKAQIFAHYGNCRCCGEHRLEFLTLHHINNNGAEHRRQLKAGGIGSKDFYLWVKRTGYPSDLESACMNCNFSKGRFGYCPHEREKQNAIQVGETSPEVQRKDTFVCSLPLTRTDLLRTEQTLQRI